MRISTISPLSLVTLTAALFGAQIVWTIEQGFGSLYLKNLGLPPSAITLVWIAGPLSGIVQPIVGVLSDASTSKYRRRLWIVLSTVVTVIALIFLIRVPGLAVPSFYLLDFGLNALQTASRSLIMDRVPATHQTTANAYHGRMTHLGTLSAYALGRVDLKRSKIAGHLLGWFSSTQFGRLCVIALVILIITITVTIVTQSEAELITTKVINDWNNNNVDNDNGNINEDVQDGPSDPETAHETANTTTTMTTTTNNGGVSGLLFAPLRVLASIPSSVRYVCLVQFFAWMAYFPYLFFASTFITQAYQAAHPEEGNDDNVDLGSKVASPVMFANAVLAAICGFILPTIAPFFSRPLPLLAKPVRHAIIALFVPRRLWTFSLILMACLLLSTLLMSADNYIGSAAIVTTMGISWAITCWVPYALLMEYTRADELSPTRTPPDETTPMLQRQPKNQNNNNYISPRFGGLIIGIHNIAIVLPQFIVSLIASVIFKYVESNATFSKNSPQNVAYVFAFGGITSIIAAIFSFWTPVTQSEQLLFEQ